MAAVEDEDPGTPAEAQEPPQAPVSDPAAADAAPPEPEPEAPAEPHPEPQPVGHGLVQDNVTEPGVQSTQHVDPAGQPSGEASTHGPDDNESQLRVGEDRPAEVDEADAEAEAE